MGLDRRTFCRTVGLAAGGVSAHGVAGRATAGATEPRFRRVRGGRQVDASDITIDDATLPRELRRGERYTVRATVTNRGDSPVRLWAIYAFDGSEYILDDEQIEAGETRTIDVPDISLDQVERDLALSLREGEEYTHSIILDERTGERPEDRGARLAERQAPVRIAGDTGGDSTPTGGEESTADLQITTSSLPDTITADQSFGARMVVRNTGTEPRSPEPSYAFDGQRVLSGAPPDALPIEPGEEQPFTFGDITLRMIAQSLGGSISQGEHVHSIGFVDGPRTSAPVVVGGPGDTASTTDAVEDSQSGPTEQTDDTAGSTGQRRGFFSNSPEGEPAFLSDAVNLTVLGFVLSAAGLVHQMIQGR